MSDQAAGTLRDMAKEPIFPLNDELAQSAFDEMAAAVEKSGLPAFLADRDDRLTRFLAAAFSLSPFLFDSFRAHPELLSRIDEPFLPQIEADIERARAAWRDGEGKVSDSDIMLRLRQAKRRVAFLTALADLAGMIAPEKTTALLSDFAGAAVAATVDHLLASAAGEGKLVLENPESPSHQSGMVVLGMGKLGACELNYSSDIDIVVFFEPEAKIFTDKDDPRSLVPRLMRRLIRILQERTGDGYVFRTDLRLRPDPGSTALAIPVEAALLYYESRGQNWERAAFIKARPIAGDLAAGEAFLAEMVPFIFRKYLDYAAIADIHSIKRQIHAHKGFGLVAVHGHNVKLGRGGIREIEFFVQTQQLIAGGRMPELRCRRTVDALEALREARWIDKATADELAEAYWFLRDVEHRIQMVRDEQSHVLPEDDAELLRIARMSGFETTEAFSGALLKALKTVERRYARLFEREETLSGEAGNLVFTGEDDDPGTLETLRKLGFDRPEDIARVVRTWHYGRYRATQTTKARQRLTEIMPELLKAFGASRRGDEALLRFDRFLSGLPAGVQLFSLLKNNPNLMLLIVEVMSAAPRLAEIIAARAHIVDGMLDPALMTEIPTRDYLAGRLEDFMSGVEIYEERLDRLRIFAAEQRFLIGIRLVTGSISGFAAGRALTTLATLVIDEALQGVLAQMEEAHGTVDGQRACVLAMGKLGSSELTAGSDVDVIVLYDCDDPLAMSSGPKQLDVPRYFARVTQRLVAALSAPTAEGVLYEVDMRLRPSGNAGPLATRLAAFEKYQLNDAWTWEHMALSRAHPLCGDPSLMADTGAVIDAILGQKRDHGKLARDIADMRSRIERDKPAKSAWDLKLIPGGLIDIEFLAQYCHLACHVPRGEIGGADAMTTDDVLARFGPEVMAAGDLETCRKALALYTDIAQLTRACLNEGFEPETAPSGLLERLCKLADCPDVSALEAKIADHARDVRVIFEKLLPFAEDKAD
ncbi:bifunctional [glutamine synthetase] adenylyltransferase/[glutamine synthetase]-adenylyl-L-tyrosine phosphorylase [Martelella lutilitoris]|uniref:Bifunctional glutamine synthetase adenylyltransferase/adenylyl-removing enzyme n=1 Tax=Martelella lutilitoris TaxID=2583532 RepID=A0A7T7KK14_9HYPH|nr:bifunctional [glutamine synthetase] adenylyltransferase/[glutamine synthetase]-adenylyl-L-tyrosine phosphorylase [Martelella lutilitoris]QQM29207.1 bifunctional [glutamine synthetase] adenylyltransferase/[glutamine synthetase]-adenylyl-L-tyrosine phosphorylase [Martelella lutilitoris]